MTTTDYQPLLGMVFKIKFLKTMLEYMSLREIDVYCNTVQKIGTGEATEQDFRDFDNLFLKFERTPDASKISATG